MSEGFSREEILEDFVRETKVSAKKRHPLKVAVDQRIGGASIAGDLRASRQTSRIEQVKQPEKPSEEIYVPGNSHRKVADLFSGKIVEINLHSIPTGLGTKDTVDIIDQSRKTPPFKARVLKITVSQQSTSFPIRIQFKKL